MIDGLGDISHLQAPGGLIFLWTTTRAVEMGILCLEKWGYSLVEEMVWVKVNQLGRIIRTGMTGHWLNHTKEHCLVGMKGSGPNQLVDTSVLMNFNFNIDLDVIVSEVRETSRKPDELYGIIDRLLGDKKNTARKLEIFARENNLREGYMSLGN